MSTQHAQLALATRVRPSLTSKSAEQTVASVVTRSKAVVLPRVVSFVPGDPVPRASRASTGHDGYGCNDGGSRRGLGCNLQHTRHETCRRARDLQHVRAGAVAMWAWERTQTCGAPAVKLRTCARVFGLLSVGGRGVFRAVEKKPGSIHRVPFRGRLGPDFLW